MADLGGAVDWTAIAHRLAPHFERAEPGPRAMAWVRGLLRPAARQNHWQVAEVHGDTTPDAVQHLRRRGLYDPEAVRDARRHDIVPPRGDAAAVLGLNATGVLNQGRHAAGVARQSRGTAGRVATGQIGVFVGDASGLGDVLRARVREVPEAWINDRERCQDAGGPAGRHFATHPQLASPPPGAQVTASRAMSTDGGEGWRCRPTQMSWRFPVKSRWGWTGSHAGAKPSWRPSRTRAGRRPVQARARSGPRG